jgi:hypothetical protein
MRQTIDKAQESFVQTSGYLSKRLASLLRGYASKSNREKLMLDIEISKQCIDVYKLASKVSRQKTYRVGEVVADGDSD